MIAATAALVLALGGAAKPELNVDCDIGWQGCWRPTDWIPIEVRIQSPAKTPLEAVVSVSARQDELTTCTVRHRVVLTPDVMLAVPLVAKIDFSAPDLRLEIRDDKGRLLYESERALFDFSERRRQIESIPEYDLLIIASGRPSFGILDLGEHAASAPTAWRARGGDAAARQRAGYASQNLYHPSFSKGGIRVKEKTERGLPWDWPAYAAVDLLVLYDAAWTALRPEQCRAIADHVSRGGGLLLVLGGSVLPPDHALAKLLPFAVGEARERKIPPALAREWGLADAAAPSIPVWSIDGARQSAAEVMSFTPEGESAECVYYAAAPVGLGRAGVLAFDPARLRGVAPARAAHFWARVMRPVLSRLSIRAEEGSAGGDNQYAFNLGVRAGGDRTVMAFEYGIPELRPIGAGWVIVLLVGLAIVIGPVDYLLLKRFDRLPLTWLTLPAYLIVFSALAFWGIQALRAGRAQARAVTVLDMVAGRPEAWSCTHAGIYAPASDDWRPVDARRPQWWSSFSPREDDTIYSYRRSRPSRRLECIQEDGRTVPTYMPINIWSMQSVLLEERVAAAPPVALENLDIDGARLGATVANAGEHPIAWSEILVRRNEETHALKLGAFAPGERREVRGSLAPWRGIGTAREHPMARPGEPPAAGAALAALAASGNIDRSRAYERLLDEGWAVVYLLIEDPPLPFSLEGKEYDTRHVKLVRLAVRPE
ncbi:MAG TPA: hypothetical protein DCM87_01475 [Planctomycetes bacterium]|nr:hypothetical protein [Planctomycetota bacterium]